MAERLVTATELRDNLDALVQHVEAGETVVLVSDAPGQAAGRRVVLLSAAAYANLAGPKPDEKTVEAKVGGVAGGLVAGTGAALSSVTGNPGMAKDARSLGRRIGRALAVGINALDEPKKKR